MYDYNFNNHDYSGNGDTPGYGHGTALVEKEGRGFLFACFGLVAPEMGGMDAMVSHPRLSLFPVFKEDGRIPRVMGEGRGG